MTTLSVERLTNHCLAIPQIHVNHRIGFPIGIGVENVQPVEKLALSLENGAKRADQQRLPKAARTRQKIQADCEAQQMNGSLFSSIQMRMKLLFPSLEAFFGVVVNDAVKGWRCCFFVTRSPVFFDFIELFFDEI